MSLEIGQSLEAGAGAGAAGGGMDPITAIANAAGELFGMIGQFSDTRQSTIEGQNALLLASQPKPRTVTQDKSGLYLVGALLLVLAVLLFFGKK
jgi:hypothetical protein